MGNDAPVCRCYRSRTGTTAIIHFSFDSESNSVTAFDDGIDYTPTNHFISRRRRLSARYKVSHFNKQKLYYNTHSDTIFGLCTVKINYHYYFRSLLAPVTLGGQAVSWAAGKLETNRNGLPTSPSSSDVQSRVLQAAAKLESQPPGTVDTQDLPQVGSSGNEEVNISEA